MRELVATSFVARVATRSRAGLPALTPLWFVADRGRLYFGTARSSLAARNAAADPQVAILFDGEGAGPRDHVLRLRGRATVHERLPSARLLLRFAARYYARGLATELRHATLWRLRQRYYAQAEPAVLEVEPEVAELLRRPA